MALQVLEQNKPQPRFKSATRAGNTSPHRLHDTSKVEPLTVPIATPIFYAVAVALRPSTKLSA